MEKRKLGRSGIDVSPLGLGAWAIGGPFYLDGKADGWGKIDDAESIRAIHRALDMGINYIDTADAYGVGHSEEVIGKAIHDRRDRCVISSKFGHFGNESTKTIQGVNIEPDYIERACEASLRRLASDYLDVYFLHVWEVSISELEFICDKLDELVQKGKIRSYGWSTDLLDGAELMSRRKNCCAIQQQLSVLTGDIKMVKLCEQKQLASINRSPLGMGLLSGKFSEDAQLPKDDVRGSDFTWMEHLFKHGKPVPQMLKKLDAIRDVLCSNGRSLAQGALAWLWGISDSTVPIPGFKSMAQVEENAHAMDFGPLDKDQIKEIDSILSR